MVGFLVDFPFAFADMPEVALVDSLVHMDLVVPLVASVDSFAIDCLVVFRMTDSYCVDEVDDDLLVDDLLGDQIVGDLNMKSLLMVHGVVEDVGLCYDHFFFLLVIEIDIDHGIGHLEFLVVASVCVQASV